MSKESKIDLDALDLHIANYANGNALSPSDLPPFLGEAVSDAPVAFEEEETEQDRHIHLEPPFLAVQYSYGEPEAGTEQELDFKVNEGEKLVRIESFQLNIVGIPENPQAVIQHLKHVIEHLETLDGFDHEQPDA